MKWNTSENIRHWRKAKGFSQEQLAEALGVSFAAVSKWERDVATPDLRYLVEMADLFEVSVDTLVGYRVQSNAINDVVERIRTLKRQKQFEEAAAEAEKALLRYPNDFRVVYHSGAMYEMMGVEAVNPAQSRKALTRGVELLARSLLLINQNEDPDISETAIRAEIAACYLSMGQTAKGIELLKVCNVGGMNNARIGMELALHEAQPAQEAANYLVKALADSINNLVLAMTGYANYYARQNRYEETLAALEWLAGFLESLKTEDQRAVYVDKILAPVYGECAGLHAQLGQTEKVRPCIERAYQLAARFDAAPVYSMAGIRFAIGDTREATAYDDLGSTAMEAVENQMNDPEYSPAARALWQELRQEQEEKG